MNSSDNHKPYFVFLDRDGTIIEEKNYLSRLQDISFITGSEEAIRRLNCHNAKVVVITNQSGIARGYFSEGFVQQAHDHMQEHLKKSNAKLDGLYYCPHRPNDNCSCRKPQPGMFEAAAKDFSISLNGFMIGDKGTDLAAGRNAGLQVILVRSGYGGEVDTSEKYNADYIAQNLSDAVDWILQQF